MRKQQGKAQVIKRKTREQQEKTVKTKAKVPRNNKGKVQEEKPTLVKI